MSNLEHSSVALTAKKLQQDGKIGKCLVWVALYYSAVGSKSKQVKSVDGALTCDRIKINWKASSGVVDKHWYCAMILYLS